MRCIAALLLSGLVAVGLAADTAPLQTDLRFEITVAKGFLPAPRDGRMLVVLGRGKKDPEPRQSINETGNEWPPVLGVDARGLFMTCDAGSDGPPPGVRSLNLIYLGSVLMVVRETWNHAGTDDPAVQIGLQSGLGDQVLHINCGTVQDCLHILDDVGFVFHVLIIVSSVRKCQ